MGSRGAGNSFLICLPKRKEQQPAPVPERGPLSPGASRPGLALGVFFFLSLLSKVLFKNPCKEFAGPV